MARYIDADALYKETEKKIKEANSYRMAVVDGEFLDLINDAETEDVAPKTEVAREIIDIIEQRRSLKEDASKGHYVDFWKGVYQGVDWAYRDIKEIIEQKYTEGNNG